LLFFQFAVVTMAPALGTDRRTSEASGDLYCAAGKHSLLWLEHPGSATTTTFYGNDSTISNSGIRGTLLG